MPIGPDSAREHALKEPTVPVHIRPGTPISFSHLGRIMRHIRTLTTKFSGDQELTGFISVRAWLTPIESGAFHITNTKVLSETTVRDIVTVVPHMLGGLGGEWEGSVVHSPKLTPLDDHVWGEYYRGLSGYYSMFSLLNAVCWLTIVHDIDIQVPDDSHSVSLERVEETNTYLKAAIHLHASPSLDEHMISFLGMGDGPRTRILFDNHAILGLGADMEFLVHDLTESVKFNKGV